jgi:WD40 repeat protein
MSPEQQLKTVNQIIFEATARYLTDVETIIVLGARSDQTYEQIAAESGYSVSYLKRDVGPKLWRLLSEILGEKVSKTNFRQALERYQTNQNSLPLIQNLKSKIQNQTDWGEAPDVSLFFGRTTELMTLTQWILKDGCRLVALLGIGGIGKTMLGVKLAQGMGDNFDVVIWRSLRNAPTLETLLTEIMPIVSHQQETRPQLSLLLNYLRCSRCLLILDNLEAILQPKKPGRLQDGYHDYGQLLRLVAETNHHSCVIVTSREKPLVIASRDGEGFPVRSLTLSGLQTEALALLTAKGLSGSLEAQQTLIDNYSGNPLALKIVATSIVDLFDGNIAEFLAQGTFLFNGVRQLLEQQFDRLSPLEQTIMYWLAINREWTNIKQLQEDIVPSLSSRELLEGLEGLSWRNLLEKQGSSYTQQPVVMEYVSDRLIETIIAELTNLDFNLFIHHALLKTTVKDYIRETQIRLLLTPIARKIQKHFRTAPALKQQILLILERLRQQANPLSNYGGGNLLNLCITLKLDISGFDFSRLSIWHAYLPQAKLHHVNFAYGDLTHAVFAETFGGVLAVDFSPDGKLLASGDTEGFIYLRDVATGQVVDMYHGHTSWVRGVAFSPDGQLLASGSHDFTVKLWHLTTGNCLHTLSHDDITGRLAWSPDGKQLASGSFDQTIKIWDVATGNCLHTLRKSSNMVTALDWSAEGKNLACCGGNNQIYLWDGVTKTLRYILREHQDKVWYLTFSPDGQWLASSSQDNTLKIWSVATGDCLRTLPNYNTIVWWMVFSPEGQTLIGGCEDGKIRLWDLETEQCFKTLSGHLSSIWSVAVSRDGKHFASGSDDCTVKLWDAETGDCLKTWSGHLTVVWAVDFHPTGFTLASGYHDGKIRLWDRHQGTCLKTLCGHNNIIWGLSWSPDGKILASASQDKTITLWNTQTGKCIYTLPEYLTFPHTVAWHPDGQILASSYLGGIVKLWDTYTRDCLQTIVYDSPMYTLDWNQSGTLLVGGTQQGTIQFFDGETGDRLQAFVGHTNSVFSVKWSPDNQLLASGSHDNTIKLWDINTEQCIYTLAEHTNWVWSIAWHPQGHSFASASEDGTVRLWDVKTRKCFQVLLGHRRGVRSVKWSADGQFLLTGSVDETIKLWEFNTGRCLQTLRPKKLYEGMNITDITGISDAQKENLKTLGAT